MAIQHFHFSYRADDNKMNELEDLTLLCGPELLWWPNYSIQYRDAGTEMIFL